MSSTYVVGHIGLGLMKRILSSLARRVKGYLVMYSHGEVEESFVVLCHTLIIMLVATRTREGRFLALQAKFGTSICQDKV